MLLRANRKSYVINLPHDVVCAATGRCRCTRREVPRRVLDADGKPSVRFDRVRLAASVTVGPTVPVEVPDAVARMPRVRRAISSGRLIVCTEEG